MKAQVIIDHRFLKEQYGIYRYSIVNIIKTHRRKKDGAVFWHQITYKGCDPIYMKPHELKILEE